jgi:hypothetical protein
MTPLPNHPGQGPRSNGGALLTRSGLSEEDKWMLIFWLEISCFLWVPLVLIILWYLFGLAVLLLRLLWCAYEKLAQKLSR